MLVVKVELHSAITGEVTEIGRMLIANDGTSRDPDRGDYNVKVGRRGVTDDRKIWMKPHRTGKVLNYPRLAYSVWVLVARALQSVKFLKDDTLQEE